MKMRQPAEDNRREDEAPAQVDPAELPELSGLAAEIRVLAETNHEIVKALDRYVRTTRFSAVFLRGALMGLGTVIGGTLLITLLVLILGWLTSVPLIGEWFEGIVDALKGPT